MKPISENVVASEMKIEIEEPTADSNSIENEESSTEILQNLTNNTIVCDIYIIGLD